MILDRSPILGPMAPGKLRATHLLLIILFGLLILLPGTLPIVRPLAAHEVLAAQPAREMLRDGHWIIQTYAGVPRYEKPPTTGWLIAASMTIFHSQSEWVIRLPSVLSGILAALLVAMLAARWMGPTVGTLAALIQLTSYWVLKQAILAEADMPLATAITAAFALFAIGNVDHPHGTLDRPWVRRAFMAATGIAYLIKGPVPLVFIFSGIALYIILRRQWSSLRFFTDPIGLAILLVLLVAWPAAVLIADPSALTIWRQELTGYATEETFGRSSPWLYLHDIPLVLLPWFGLLVVAAIETIQHRLYRLPLTLFLLCWFIPGMIVLQFAAYKSVHYAFPLLPPASIAMAAGMIWWLRRQTCRPLVPHIVTVLLIAIVSAAGIIAVRIFAPSLPASVYAAIAICSAAFILAVILERSGRIGLELSILFGAVALAVIITDLSIIPHMPGTWTRMQFAQRINQRVPPGQPLYLVDFATDETVWYLTMPLKRYDNLAKFAEVDLPAPSAPSAPSDGVYALVRDRTLTKLSPRYNWQELDRASEAKLSDTKHSESRLPVLVRLQQAPASQPTSAP